MPHYDFLWTPSAIEHIADNDVTTEDFESVVCDPDRVRRSRSSGRPCAIGYTADGRTILCVYEHLDELQVLPVTAYSIEGNE